MFSWVLLGHSLMRWVVLGLGAVAFLRAIRAYSERRPWSTNDTIVGLGFALALDLQLAVGLLLYIYSPITILGRHEIDLAMSTRVLRFWTFEHPVVMTAAVLVAHMGLVGIRRHAVSALGHRAAAIFFGLALLLVLAGIPWPFLQHGRPLFWMLR